MSYSFRAGIIPGFFALLLVGALAAGCSGGGGSTPQPSRSSNTNGASAGQTLANARIVLTAGKLPAGARRSQYVSPSIAGLSIVVTPAGGSPAAAVLADVSLLSTACATAVTGARTCTIALTIPVGAASLGVTTYDAAPANGAVAGKTLSTATVPITISASTPNVIALALNGVATNVTLALGTPLQFGQSGSMPLTVNALDADGNSIVGADPYSTPITLTNTDTTGVTTLSATSVTAPSNAIALNYTGVVTTATASIGASAAGVTATVTPVTFRPQGYWQPFTGSVKQIVISDVFTRVVPVPYPTLSPYPAPSTQFLPAPVVSASPSQYSAVFASAIVTFTPPPNPSPTSTPVFAAVAGVNHITKTYLASAATALSAVREDYVSYAPDGNRVDAEYFGTFTHTAAVIGGAGPSSGPTDTYVGSFFPTPQVVAKLPVTPGDTWTNEASRTDFTTHTALATPVNVTNSSSIIRYRAIGGYSWNTDQFYHAGNTLWNGAAGSLGATVEVATDGTAIEHDYSPDGTYAETDTSSAPAGGTITSSYSLVPNPGDTPVTGSNVYPDYITPLGGPKRTDTFVVGALTVPDAQCGLSTPQLAFPITETLHAMTPYQATNETRTTVTYWQPGLGFVCSVTTYIVQGYSFLYEFISQSNLVIFEVGYSLIPATTTTDVAVQTLQYGTTVQSHARTTASIGGGPMIPDGMDSVFQLRAQARIAARKGAVR